MTKLETKVNCWQAFLACMLELPLEYVESCATTHSDWEQRTDEVLRNGFDGFFIEADPTDISALPAGLIVGAGVTTPNNGRAHVVIAKVLRDGNTEAFEVYHDPSGKHKEGTLLLNVKSVILLVKNIANENSCTPIPTLQETLAGAAPVHP